MTQHLLAAGLLALTAVTARADIFGSGANTFTIDFVNIGNAGNADDAGAGGGQYSSPYGGVAYAYRMGTYEIPQDAISKATNLGMTNVTAGPWTGSQPAASVTWYETAAFVNFLNTSSGHQAAYDLTFSGSWSMRLWSSAQAWQAGGENLYRHKDAFYFLPSEDEWYKAAFHKNDGVTANYWDYATGSNTIPTAVASGTAAGTVVYNQSESQGPANVDNNGGLSPYGTRGQHGNVQEWQESAFTAPNDSSSEARSGRGAAYALPPSFLDPSVRFASDPAMSFGADQYFGFRVASVPEPSSTVLLLSASLLAFARRRRAKIRYTSGG